MGHCTGLYSRAPFPFGVKPVNTCSQSVFGGSESNSPTRVEQPGKPPTLNQLYFARFWLSYTVTCVNNLWRWVKCVLRHKIAPVAACVTYWNYVLFAFFPKVDCRLVFDHADGSQSSRRGSTLTTATVASMAPIGGSDLCKMRLVCWWTSIKTQKHT